MPFVSKTVMVNGMDSVPHPTNNNNIAQAAYLVAVFFTSAGANLDDLLGSDEEEIVQITFLAIEVSNNKVVAVQQFPVKPHVTELHEQVLTATCKEDTSIDEASVRNAQPLDNVIAEFDQFVKSKLHTDVGRSFFLVTDGQLHMRQVLHPECCHKGIELGEHFFYFFDLRKEFRKMYKKQVGGLADMLEYLSIDADKSCEYGIRQVQDMGHIIQKMISNGHVFQHPETVMTKLEPGICQKEDQVDSNHVIRARGLPWQSSDMDIAKFFRGLNIAKGGIALCLSTQGRRNGEALVRFVSEEHRDMALKRHKHHIQQRYIEVYKAPGDEFVSVAGTSTEAQMFLSKGAAVIIRMRGLPYDAKANNVLEFFENSDCPTQVMDAEEGVLFVKKPDGRATGDAFVLFDKEESAGRALKKHRELMGQRYIELFRSTTAEVQQVLNRAVDPKCEQQQQQQQLPLMAQMPQQAVAMPTAALPAGHTMVHAAAAPPVTPTAVMQPAASVLMKNVIRLRGLPFEARVEDILQFLGDQSKNIVMHGVHMVLNTQGLPTGEAFIQMDSEQTAYICASQRHNRYMYFAKKQRYIEVFQCSQEDMCSSIGVTSQYPQSRGVITPAMLQNAYYPYAQQAAYIAAAAPHHHHHHHHPQHQHHRILPTAAVHPISPYYYHHSAAAAAAAAATAAHWTYPSPPVSPTSVTTGYYQQQQQQQQTAGTAMPQGPTVIVLRGLPYNASQADILSFFQGYQEIGPENIQIQRSVDGRPSGDAYVTFLTRHEAERAIQEKNRQNIGNRYIELFMA